MHWKLLKPYAEVDSKATMHLIQCPHCGDDIELEDGASGLFVCPYCDKDFTWNGDVKIIVVDDDLGDKLEVFLFSIFSPSLLFFALTSLPSLDTMLGLISIGICVVYTLSLAIYSGLKKNKPLLQGILISLVASYLVIYMYAMSM